MVIPAQRKLSGEFARARIRKRNDPFMAGLDLDLIRSSTSSQQALATPTAGIDEYHIDVTTQVGH